MNGDIGTVGITDFAAVCTLILNRYQRYFEGQLGDVVYAECPDVDSKVEKGDTAGAVESVKVSLPSRN